MNFKSLLVAWVIGSGAMLAQAVQFDYGSAVDNGNGTWTVSAADFFVVDVGTPASATIDKFSTAEGRVLSSVVITWSSTRESFSGTLAGLSGDKTLSISSASVTFNNGQADLGSISFADVSQMFVLPGDNGLQRIQTAQVGSTSTYTGGDTVFYTAGTGGPDTYNLTAAFVGISAATGSAIFSGPEFKGNGIWQVAYTYVPEPTSASLLLLGAMAIGLRRRFNKAV